MTYNPDEPRDERGRWTDGGASIAGAGWRGKPVAGGPANRARALAFHALLSLPASLRRRSVWTDPEAIDRLGRLIRRWSGAADLDDDGFRDRYLGGGVAPGTIRDLRSAAAIAMRAGTAAEMAGAGDRLAAAMAAVGADGWLRFLRSADDRLVSNRGSGVRGRGGFQLVQSPGIEEENARRGLLGEFIDPTAELRRQEFFSLEAQLRLIAPSNRYAASISAPDWIPREEDIDRISDELQQVREDIAHAIANGHGYEKHQEEFASRYHYEAEILETLSNPSEARMLRDGRRLFYRKSDNMLVFVDPNSDDLGSAFHPTRGQSYVDERE